MMEDSTSYHGGHTIAGVDPGLVVANLQRLRARDAEVSPPRGKVALVLQGGAMRGVFGAGACCALEEMGYTDVFDHVFGVSAGALNAAYFLSGQAAFGATIYYQDISNRKFINCLRPRKIVDIDYLMGIIEAVKPLDVDRLMHSPTILNVGLTKVSTGESVFINVKELPNRLLDILKATAAIPFAYDCPVSIEGCLYVDGGIASPVPVQEALEAGCSDILVVLTRPLGFDPLGSRTLLERFVVAPAIKKRYGRGLHSAFISQHERHAQALGLLGVGARKHLSGIRIAVVAPGLTTQVRRMTTNCLKLKQVAIDGAMAMFHLFGIDSARPTEILRFLHL